MAPQEIVFTEEDFLIYELRHEELIEGLKDVATSLSKLDTDSSMIDVLTKQSDEIKKLISVIDVGLKNQNLNKLSSLLQSISADIVKSNASVIKTLETRLLPDTFTLVRNGFTNYVEEVKVNYKQANAIK